MKNVGNVMQQSKRMQADEQVPWVPEVYLTQASQFGKWKHKQRHFYDKLMCCRETTKDTTFIALLLSKVLSENSCFNL